MQPTRGASLMQPTRGGGKPDAAWTIIDAVHGKLEHEYTVNNFTVKQYLQKNYPIIMSDRSQLY